MRNLKLTIEYDGTDYNGWQIQPIGVTIQGELTRVLSLLDHRPVTIHGAGRTDAGVHAEGQVASLLFERDFALNKLRDAVNANLKRDLRVRAVESVDASFNARQSAKLKTYVYRIWNGEVVSPFVYRFVHHYQGPLDLEVMRRSALHLVGKHDFTAFTGTNSESATRVRRIERLDIESHNELISIVVTADGFLRYMVRAIAGTLIEVGRGRISPEQVSTALASLDRKQAGPTAPAAGLTLLRVDY